MKLRDAMWTGVLLTCATAQAQVPGNAYSYSRTTAFVYDASTGLLAAQIKEPDIAALCVRA